jgi:hypothetical protein
MLEKEEGTEFAPKLPGALPPGGSSRTLVAQDVLDANGKVVMSTRAVELIKKHDNDQGI